MFKRGKYPAYTNRTYEKYGVDSAKLEQTTEDLEALQAYPVDYIGFSYYMSTAVNETDPDAAASAGNLLGGVKNPFSKTVNGDGRLLQKVYGLH